MKRQHLSHEEKKILNPKKNPKEVVSENNMKIQTFNFPDFPINPTKTKKDEGFTSKSQNKVEINNKRKDFHPQQTTIEKRIPTNNDDNVVVEDNRISPIYPPRPTGKPPVGGLKPFWKLVIDNNIIFTGPAEKLPQPERLPVPNLSGLPPIEPPRTPRK